MVTLKKVALLCAAAVTVAMANPAMAEWKNKQVQYEDLDLSLAKDQQRLQTRIKYAVKAVCNSPRAMTLAEKMDVAACENAAMAKAMPKAERIIAAQLETKRMAANEAAIVGN